MQSLQQQSPTRLDLWHLTVALLLVAFVFGTTPLKADYDGLLHIHVLDIGQGDSILIVTPSGRQILIDGGPDMTVLTRLGEYMPPWDRSLDAVVVSHPHADHIAGLIGVLDRYQVDRVIEAGETYDSAQFRAWQSAVVREEGEHVEALAGQTLDLGDGATLHILAPFYSVAGTATKKPHEDSVVVLLEYGDFKLLLTGDMEAKLEQQLITKALDLNVDVLKVGHHGSKTSTSQALLAATTPQLGIISVGAHNIYRLPAPSTLDRLASNGIPYYSTDTSGTVSVVSDGQQFSVSTSKK